MNHLILTIVLSLFNPYINITFQKFSSTPFHLLFIILYSSPSYGSTPVLPGYLLLWHSCTWDKISIFWSCQVFGAVAGDVSYCVNYIFYFIFLFTFIVFLIFFYFFYFFFFPFALAWEFGSGRLCRKSSSSSENMAEEDNQSLHNENNEINWCEPRDHMVMQPTRKDTNSRKAK